MGIKCFKGEYKVGDGSEKLRGRDEGKYNQNVLYENFLRISKKN